jgi:hypothetical protein
LGGGAVRPLGTPTTVLRLPWEIYPKESMENHEVDKLSCNSYSIRTGVFAKRGYFSRAIIISTGSDGMDTVKLALGTMALDED